MSDLEQRQPTFAIGTILALAIFGPKLGPLDSSALAGPLGLLLLKGRNLTLDRRLRHIGVLAFLSVLLALLSTILVGSGGYLIVGRQLRVLLTTVVLGTFVHSLARANRVSPSQILHILIVVLALNAVAVGAELSSSRAAALLADAYGFNKSIRSLRGFGLTAGFDAAGYLCLLGALTGILTLLRASDARRWVPIATGGMLLAALFTSRVSMAGALILGVFWLAGTMSLPGAVWAKASALTLSALLAVPLGLVAIPVLTQTLGYGSPQAVSAGSVSDAIARNYSATDISTWSAEAWVVGVPWPRVLVGVAADPGITDVGYVVGLASLGIVGLAVMMLIHVRLMAVGLGATRSRVIDRDVRALAAVVLFAGAAMLLMNIKGQYVGTRGFFELHVVAAGSLAGFTSTARWS